MFTYILILDSNEALQSAVAQFAELGDVRVYENDYHVILESGGHEEGWISVTANPAVREDYEPEDLEKITALISNPHFLVVGGRDGPGAMSSAFIARLKGLDGAIIDNAQGIVAPLQVFKDLISRGFDWMYAPSLPDGM